MLNEKIEKQYKFNNIMQFIKFEITNFKSFYSDSQEKAGREREIRSLQIKMRLFTILDLLKSTLINGMWTI